MAVVEEPTEELAAARVGVSTVTLWRWKKIPAFQLALRQAQDDIMAESTRRLRHAGRRAVDTLTRNMDCGVPSVEVRAATVAVDMALKAVEIDDRRRRIEELESGRGVRDA